MLKWISIVVLVFIVGVLGMAATKPDSFAVEREILIKAPPEKIFPKIDDLHGFVTWSPFEKLDPEMKRTFSGPERGKGAAYAWEGNSDAGTGRMEITESTPSSKVVMKLDFIKPFEGHDVAEFTLTPEGDQTKVKWAVHGPSTFITKVMCVFVSMDKMLGTEFENGLATLKTQSES